VGRLTEIQIELSGVCSAACTHCTWRKRTVGKQHMDTGLALRLLEDAKALGIKTVRLHGVGESLLHPRLLEIVRRSEELGLGHSLSTNCHELVGEPAAGLRTVRSLQFILAIPWAMPDDFVDVCVKNALEYLPSRNEAVHIQLVCHVDAQRHLQRFLNTFMPLAERYPNVLLHLKQPVTWPNDTPNQGFTVPELRSNPKIMNDARATPLSIAKNCDMPERFLMVCADGTVVPCCVGMDDWGLGQLGERSLREVWNSAAMQRLRELWARADDSIPCGRCKKRTDCIQ